MPQEMKINRVRRSKEDARTSYNAMSKWYDWMAASEKKYKDLGLQLLAAQTGETALEIGFGTGQCITALARSVGPTGKVFGIDLSEGMLEVAQSRVNKADLEEHVELHCGDAVKLPFNSGYFDRVYMSFTLELFDTPEIPIVLQECKRVLRDGGRICIAAMSRHGGGSLLFGLYEWTQKKFTKVVDCRPIYLQEAIEAAGFQVEDTIVESLFTLPVEIVLARKN